MPAIRRQAPRRPARGQPPPGSNRQGRDARLKPLQVLQQPGFGRRGLAPRLRIGKKGVPVPLESHVRLAAGEVQVAEDFLQDSRIRLCRFALRRGPLYFHVVSKPSCTRFGKMNAEGATASAGPRDYNLSNDRQRRPEKLPSPMGYRNLQECVHDLERTGQLVRIETEIDPHLQAAEDPAPRVPVQGPALFYARVKGSRFPMVSNLFGTGPAPAQGHQHPASLGVPHLRRPVCARRSQVFAVRAVGDGIDVILVPAQGLSQEGSEDRRMQSRHARHGGKIVVQGSIPHSLHSKQNALFWVCGT